jgi:hypothetical protein
MKMEQITQKQPKKMGRPRKLNPLTPAQRHKRWREKRKAQVAELVKIFQEANEK